MEPTFVTARFDGTTALAIATSDHKDMDGQRRLDLFVFPCNATDYNNRVLLDVPWFDAGPDDEEAGMHTQTAHPVQAPDHEDEGEGASTRLGDTADAPKPVVASTPKPAPKGPRGR